MLALSGDSPFAQSPSMRIISQQQQQQYLNPTVASSGEYEGGKNRTAESRFFERIGLPPPSPSDSESDFPPRDSDIEFVSEPEDDDERANLLGPVASGAHVGKKQRSKANGHSGSGKKSGITSSSVVDADAVKEGNPDNCCCTIL